MSWALQWLPSRLATHCGSPRLYDSQWINEGWSDPPRPASVAEWLELMSAWHRLLHGGNPEARSKNWPLAAPTIFKFSADFDLPVPAWAVENATRHGWADLLELAETLDDRHVYLRSLTPGQRLELFKVERCMRHLQQDRAWALLGYVQTGPCKWAMGRRLLTA
jgi:hypothetical protein